MITIFAAPKPFEGHIGVIQRNAVRSWVELGDEVEVLLLGKEIGLDQIATEQGIRWLEVRARNEHGTPLLSAIFARATEAASSDLMCYVNADILLFDDLLAGARQIASRWERFLLAGQRWDLDVRQPLDFSEGWQQDLRRELVRRGRRHRKTGSDYFVYPKRAFTEIPPFALGRAGWDNWMIYDARRREIPVIDGSTAVTVVHQDHDYAHLPGSQPHYRLPESAENVRLAGGRRHIFTLHNADWMLGADGPRRRGWSLRGLEGNLQLRFGSSAASEFIFAVFHPVRAMRQWIGGFRARLRIAETE